MHQNFIAAFWAAIKSALFKQRTALPLPTEVADWGLGQGFVRTDTPVPQWWIKLRRGPSLTLINGGGGGVTGDQNAMVFIDPAGTAAITSPAFLGGRMDAYQRPCVRDFRFNPASGRGAVNKLGAWSMDGDPENVISEGYVTYGGNCLGNGPNAIEGGYGFYTPNSFGVMSIIPGVNGGSLFYLVGCGDNGPLDPWTTDGFVVNQKDATRVAQIYISSGISWFREASMDKAHASQAPNKMSGLVVLGAGPTPVANTSVTPGSQITLTIQPGGPPPTAGVYVQATAPGAGFTIASLPPGNPPGVNVYYQIWEP